MILWGVDVRPGRRGARPTTRVKREIESERERRKRRSILGVKGNMELFRQIDLLKSIAS